MLHVHTHVYNVPMIQLWQMSHMSCISPFQLLSHQTQTGSRLSPTHSSRGAPVRGRRGRRQPLRTGDNLGRKCLGSVSPRAQLSPPWAGLGVGAGAVPGSCQQPVRVQLTPPAALITVPRILQTFKSCPCDISEARALGRVNVCPRLPGRPARVRAGTWLCLGS